MTLFIINICTQIYPSYFKSQENITNVLRAIGPFNTQRYPTVGFVFQHLKINNSNLLKYNGGIYRFFFRLLLLIILLKTTRQCIKFHAFKDSKFQQCLLSNILDNKKLNYCCGSNVLERNIICYFKTIRQKLSDERFYVSQNDRVYSVRSKE